MGNSHSILDPLIGLGLLMGHYEYQIRLKAWLKNVSQERIYEGLDRSFFARIDGYGRGGLLLLPARREGGALSELRDTFTAFARSKLGDKDTDHVWDQSGFSRFLHQQFPGVISESSVSMLWRSFLFHAYFPFPIERRVVDYRAFRRAVAFLAGEGTFYLGEDAEGIPMDIDQYPNMEARELARNDQQLCMLFRSLAVAHPCIEEKKPLVPTEIKMPDSEKDILDILMLVKPSHPCTMSTYEALRPYARKLMSEIPRQAAHYAIPQGDLQDLMEVILSIQIIKAKGLTQQKAAWRTIHPGSNLLTALARALVRRFQMTSENQCDIDWQSFRNILKTYLPDFQLKFRLMFATLKSPCEQSQYLAERPSENNLASEYAQYLSLFSYPSPVTSAFDSFYNPEFEFDVRFNAMSALSTASLVYSSSPESFSSVNLTNVLQSIETPTLLLVSGGIDVANDDRLSDRIDLKRVVFGAYIPTPWDLQSERKYRAVPTRIWDTYSAPHTLFQLQPMLEILRPNHDAWIMDLITVTPTDESEGRKGGIDFGRKKGTGISIDFDTGIACMRSNPAAAEDHSIAEEGDPEKISCSEAGSYDDIGRTHYISTSAWETIMCIEKLEIFDLGGEPSKSFDEIEHTGAQAGLPWRPYPVDPVALKSDMEVQQRAAAARKEQPKVEERVLKARIEGFGSK